MRSVKLPNYKWKQYASTCLRSAKRGNLAKFGVVVRALSMSAQHFDYVIEQKKVLAQEVQ